MFTTCEQRRKAARWRAEAAGATSPRDRCAFLELAEAYEAAAAQREQDGPSGAPGEDS